MNIHTKFLISFHLYFFFPIKMHFKKLHISVWIKSLHLNRLCLVIPEHAVKKNNNNSSISLTSSRGGRKTKEKGRIIHLSHMALFIIIKKQEGRARKKRKKYNQITAKVNHFFFLHRFKHLADGESFHDSITHSIINTQYCEVRKHRLNITVTDDDWGSVVTNKSEYIYCSNSNMTLSKSAFLEFCAERNSSRKGSCKYRFLKM